LNVEMTTNALDLLAFVLITPQILKMVHLSDILRPFTRLRKVPEFVFRPFIPGREWTRPLHAIAVVALICSLYWTGRMVPGKISSGIIGWRLELRSVFNPVIITYVAILLLAQSITIVRRYDLEATAFAIGSLLFVTARFIGFIHGYIGGAGPD
jgi:hypothetical protein